MSFTTVAFADALCKDTSGTTLSAHKTERVGYHLAAPTAREKTGMPPKKWVFESFPTVPDPSDTVEVPQKMANRMLCLLCKYQDNSARYPFCELECI